VICLNRLFLLAIPLVLLIYLILLSAPILLPGSSSRIGGSGFTLTPSLTLTPMTSSPTMAETSGTTCDSIISYIYPIESFPVSIDNVPPTYFSLPSCPLSSRQSGPYAYSPTAIVNASNSANAIRLLTSPYPPKQTYTDSYLFTPYNRFTGGDVCFLANTPLYPTVSYDIVARGPTPYDVSIQNFYIQNIGELDLFNLGYSPLVDNAISNGFNTKSYIYDQVPSYAQHGLWTWAAKYAELPGVSHTTEISYNYTQVDTVICYNPNGIVTSVTTTYTPLTANMYVTMSNLNNAFIPYNVITGENSYTTFNTPILPYILYNFSMPSPGSLNLPMYMNMSYDTFSPWSYYKPQNSIEPFPIDTGSQFFVNYNGVLANSNPNEITKMPWIKRKKWFSEIPNLNQVIPNYISPSISGIISIAAAQNNYIYLLNYSSSQGAYFLTMLRLIPKGYYNTTNYQPDSVGSANSEQQWEDNWNSYWTNVSALQNSSVYVVKSINLDTFNNNVLSTFQPLNISVDNFGDVFITGLMHEKRTSGGRIPVTVTFSKPALAEITNTLVNNNWAVVYNSIETNSNDQIMPEIAVSPTGSLIFLANQTDGGYIYVYSSTNFTQINQINLAYAFYPGGSSGGVPLATLNIYSWLSNDGLYNQSLSNVLDNFFVNKVTVLDAPEYHHPLGLADINGYLYVLDEWAGDIGFSSSSSWFGLFKTTTGVFFNILTLRVLNSTGSNIPINPTHFNDMYTVQSCGSPIYQKATLNPGTCYPTTQYNPGNVMCSSNCELVSDSCYINQYYGRQTHVVSGYKYSCISANTLSSTYYSLAPPYYSIGNAYPPYGWILAANVTGAQLSNILFTALYSIDKAASINFCGGNGGTPPECNFNPVNLNPANYHGTGVNYYNGSYYPIGPQLDALAMHGKDTAARTSSDIKVGWAPEYNKIGFSVNFNDSVDILFPNSTPKNPLHDIGVLFGLISETIKNPNIYKELILTKLNVENYTKLFGGLPPYNCLTNYSYYQNTVCGYMPGVEYMNPPVYTAADAFKYLESLGTPQIMPIEGVVYSTYSGNGPSSSVCGISIKEAEQNITNGNIINSGTCGPISANEVVLNSYNSIRSSSSSLSFPSPIVESLNSKLAGYILIPYTYNVLVSNEDNTISNSYQVFTYQTVGSSSNNFDSTIEGGDTYLMYSNGTYYVPNLSDYGTILSKNLITNLITNRNFANIYVNVTDQTGLYQTIANGSKTASFTINQYYLGSQPVYETISSVPESGVLFGESALSTIIPEPYKIFGAALGQGTGYYYQQFNVPSLIHLFNWYKMGLFTDTLDLYLNQSPLNPSGTTLSSGAAGPSFNTRGYTRLIYVLNDRFNNTIYLPIDADIANITQIRLNVKSVVDPSNANQTTLYITGNATYFDGVKYVPLADNSIYIYFNNNINYMQYNALLYPVNAILCAYNSMVSGPCTLANPAFTSLSQNANVITYYPQYNASGECGPPPTHLYNPLVYNCNIYGNGLPATCNSIVLQRGQEITQWCIPLAYNGMGICTSQIGLMGIATTDSTGNFSFTTNACGIGTASITAEFYGYPYNEPATVTQPYLSNSATLYYDLEGRYNVPPSVATFQVLNYTWSPNETTVSPVTLGLSELSYGSISIIWLLGLAAIAIILMYITARSKKD